MAHYDFDFKRYVERRKGARDAERREGASYAYAGDLRIRKLLARARPVELALEATVGLWRATARAEMLGTARRAVDLDDGSAATRVFRFARKAAERLHIAVPPVFLSPHAAVGCEVFGTDDEHQVLLHAGLAESLSDGELLFALGAAGGRIQNTQVLLHTARYSLRSAGSRFVRWTVGPAIASLDAWAKRGVVTSDRAGLLAARDLAAAHMAIEKLAAAPTPAGAQGAAASLADSGVDVKHRQAALEAFAKSAYYRGTIGEPGGLGPDETDKETARALKGAA